jgi:serine/threonine-protein kinase
VPANARLSFSSRPTVAVSGDGRTIVFAATVDGVDRLFVRRTGSFDATEIPGTENGSNPAISPDGRSVAFATSTRIARVSLAGGPVTQLADAVEPRGVSWDQDDSILYVPQSNGSIWRVPATGGQPARITTLDNSANERTHRWPQQLPGGALIFTSDSESTPDAYDDASIVAWMPDATRHTVLTEAEIARYVPSGHLLFARGGTLFAVAFDPQRAMVTGTPVAILHEVAGDLTTGAHHFAVSQSGTLVYVAGRNAPGSTVPAWVSRAPGSESLPLPPGGYADLRISPDGLQLAASVTGSAGSDIWVHHLQRRTFSKVTFGGENLTPMWSRNGATLYFSQLDTSRGNSTIMRRPADGSGQAERIATLNGRVYLNDVAADDRSLIVNVFASDNKGPGAGKSWIGRLPLEPNAQAVPLLNSADAFSARLSPNNRWIAYTGRNPNREVFVRPLSGNGQWQVSTGGGEEPKWSRDGRNLFYRNDNLLLAVTVDPLAAVFESSLPFEVFKGIYNLRNESGISYDVSATGARFVMLKLPEEAADALSLRLVTNWTNELK